jgi:ABC-2 type transport system permease protein
MKQLLALIKREYIQRVRNKTFIVMTLLGPFFFAILTIVPVWISTSESPGVSSVRILDQKGWFEEEEMPGLINVTQVDSSSELSVSLIRFLESSDDILIYIPAEGKIKIFTRSNLAPGLKLWLKDRIQKRYLISSGVDPSVAEKIFNGPDIEVEKLGENSSSDLLTLISILAGVLIYIFILAYTMQVMRGVVEEKSNRITELLITSVAPFRLMAGKILGIGLVSITQFFFWTVIGGAVIFFIKLRYGASLELFNNRNIENTLKIKGIDPQEAIQWNSVISSFENIDFLSFGLIFLFFFICGYLFYSSVFAAAGAAVDSETETQQFSFPLTLPILLCFTSFQEFLDNPESTVSWFFSLFPLTSPVAIMMLYPAGISTLRIALSMAVLLVSLVVMIWISGRIYRTAILMYGKKISLKELIKWGFR